MTKLGDQCWGYNIKLTRPAPGSIKVFREPQSGREVCIYENEVPKCDTGLTGFLWFWEALLMLPGMRGQFTERLPTEKWI